MVKKVVCILTHILYHLKISGYHYNKYSRCVISDMSNGRGRANESLKKKIQYCAVRAAAAHISRQTAWKHFFFYANVVLQV